MKAVFLKRRSGIVFILILWAAVAAVVFGMTLAQRVSTELKNLPVYSVETDGEKKVSLTFDVAWDDSTTDGVLKILKDNSVKASFFFVGEFAEKYPETVKKIYNAGHDTGNHSMHHKDPVKQSYSEICSDITKCNELLNSLTGSKTVLYRAPSGSYDNNVINAAQSLGMTVIQWDNDSVDWKERSAAEITEKVLKKLSPGSIMLFHLGKQNTLEALPGIIEKIKENGYEIVPVSQLLIAENYIIDYNGRQHRLK